MAVTQPNSLNERDFVITGYLIVDPLKARSKVSGLSMMNICYYEFDFNKEIRKNFATDPAI